MGQMSLNQPYIQLPNRPKRTSHAFTLSLPRTMYSYMSLTHATWRVMRQAQIKECVVLCCVV